MKRGIATRVYHVDKAKLAEALKAIDELVQPIRDALAKRRKS